MRSFRRVSAPRVIGGKVQRQNRNRSEPNYSNSFQVAVRREPAGRGFRHVLTPGEVTVFIDLLPNWKELSLGLNTILLDSGDRDCDGWFSPGTVAICAWEGTLARPMTESYYEEHEDLFRRLRVPCRRLTEAELLAEWSEWPDCEYLGEFTELTARAFQLLHILLHELGHHHDRMTSRTRKFPTRGEKYAEQYAREHERMIWSRFLSAFQLF